MSSASDLPASGQGASPRASIVVCTRNRSRGLAPTLAAALELEAPFPHEVLVIDNASTDDTVAVALEVGERAPGRLQVEVEPAIGLSAARNLGVRLARGEWLAFLDDDAVPVPGWLVAYERALGGEGVAAAGGPVEPQWTSPLPGWIAERHLPYLSVWEPGPAPFDLRYPELPRGTNMAIRREAFARVGEFDRRLGRIGRSLRSCEEIELGLRLERCGLRTVYAPEARVRHRVDAMRIDVEWLRARFAAQGFSEAIVDWKHGGRVGLRQGRARFRAGLDHDRATYGADSLDARLRRAALGAYRRGAVYAMLLVERWIPPRRA